MGIPPCRTARDSKPRVCRGNGQFHPPGKLGIAGEELEEVAPCPRRRAVRECSRILRSSTLGVTPVCVVNEMVLNKFYRGECLSRRWNTSGNVLERLGMERCLESRSVRVLAADQLAELMCDGQKVEAVYTSC